MRLIVTLLLFVALAGCTEPPFRVGSKDQTESRILAEMFALLLEEHGIEVKRITGLGSTETVFQALNDDDIDVYPEYTGTALALMGAPRTGNADQTYTVVSDALARNGLVLLERLGFESGYVVLTRPAVASSNRLNAIADLTRVDNRLRLGVTQSFAERPRDGLEPFLDRFGLAFDDIAVFANVDREGLYDALIEKRVDVIVGLTTDPEIADYELLQLQDKTGVFPDYDAAPLTSRIALERHPDVAAVLSLLADKIDNAMMRKLNAAVRLDGRPANRVARQALFDLGLVDQPPRERTPVLAIAVSPEAMGTDVSITTLRAVRKAMRGRDVDLMAFDVPLEGIASGEARLALAPAVAAFIMKDDTLVRDDRVEAVAAVGSTFLHALALSSAPVEPINARTIASGPAGSSSHKLALVIAASARSPVNVVALQDDGAHTAAAALRDGKADVALVFAAPGRQDLIDVFLQNDDITLVKSDGWWQSASRLALPVMREAQINADIYHGVDQATATLSTQLILFGPALPDHFVIGLQGPGSLFGELRPLQDKSVEAINLNLGRHAAVDPHLRRAAALAPQVNIRDDRMNPYPERAVLMVVILSFLVWAGWLLVRPEKTDLNS
jgi:glycine betaine/choline ABC-type transport system substrate-binding protein